jgi:hypothetical protein
MDGKSKVKAIPVLKHNFIKWYEGCGCEVTSARNYLCALKEIEYLIDIIT